MCASLRSSSNQRTKAPPALHNLWVNTYCKKTFPRVLYILNECNHNIRIKTFYKVLKLRLGRRSVCDKRIHLTSQGSRIRSKQVGATATKAAAATPCSPTSRHLSLVITKAMSVNLSPSGSPPVKRSRTVKHTSSEEELGGPTSDTQASDSSGSGAIARAAAAAKRRKKKKKKKKKNNNKSTTTTTKNTRRRVCGSSCCVLPLLSPAVVNLSPPSPPAHSKHAPTRTQASSSSRNRYASASSAYLLAVYFCPDGKGYSYEQKVDLVDKFIKSGLSFNTAIGKNLAERFFRTYPDLQKRTTTTLNTYTVCSILNCLVRVLFLGSVLAFCPGWFQAAKP